MPHRAIATHELARLLNTLAHRHRILIIEELRGGEQDVSSLQKAVGASASSVSQHLKLLRAQHLVSERREGRRVYYSLVDGNLARWLAEGLRFVESEIADTSDVHEAVETARHVWLDERS